MNEFKSQKSGLCCALCPAGQHPIKDCEQGYSTVCQTCPENQFTAVPNNFTSCKNCTSVKCDSASGRILKQCTPTSNSQCVCPKDKYWHIGTLRCKDCKVCGPGELVTSPCGTYEDTKCEKCPEVGRNLISHSYQPASLILLAIQTDTVGLSTTKIRSLAKKLTPCTASV